MRISQAIYAAVAVAGPVAVGAMVLPDVIKRVNDAHSEEVGNKPNLLQQWRTSVRNDPYVIEVREFFDKWGSKMIGQEYPKAEKPENPAP